MSASLTKEQIGYLRLRAEMKTLPDHTEVITLCDLALRASEPPTPTEGVQPVKCAVDSGSKSEVWRPIETAPKDGTRIDVWYRDGRVADAFWSDIQESWCVESDYPDEPTPLAIFPPITHWQPLPKGPASRGSNMP